jgi:tRNA (guanosine-2'-O-)-methyltransferase
MIKKGKCTASLFFYNEAKLMNEKLLTLLSSCVTAERLALFERVLDNRTNYITVVLEDIFQPQNASAVLRSCDCFGIQNIHVIENRNTFIVDKEVDMGATKWLTLHKYHKKDNNSLEAIKILKKKGYRIVATTPHDNDNLLPDFDLVKGKAAIVFGSEKPGISEIIRDNADEFLKIPMFGFTESFNISVSAALVLYELANRLRHTENIDWKLTQAEKNELKMKWLKSTIKRSNLIEKRFYEEAGFEKI